MRLWYSTASEGDLGYGSVPAPYMIVGLDARSVNLRSSTRLRQFVDRLPTFYATSLIKVSEASPTKRVTKAALTRWLPVLHREILRVQPRRILAVGADVARALSPEFKNLEDDHGTLFSVKRYEILLGRPVTLVPTFTFSFAPARANPVLQEAQERDFARFLSLPDPVPPSFVERAGTDGAKIPSFHQDTLVTLDLETSGLDPRAPGAEILSLTIGVPYSPTVIVYREPTSTFLRRLYQALRDANTTLQGHNLAFDLYWLVTLSQQGWFLPVRDTMLLASNRGYERLGLKHLTTMLTDLPGPHAFGSFKDSGYAAADVVATQQVATALSGPLKAIDTLTFAATTEVVNNCDWGVYIDYPRLAELTEQYRQLVAAAERKCRHVFQLSPEVQVNWNSTQRVAELFAQRGTSLTSTKESVLLELHTPEAEALLEYRALEKTLTGFLLNYGARLTPGHPLLHPKVKLAGARTGRTSCVDPNLQQVTRTGPLKTLFVPRWTSEYFRQQTEIPVPDAPGYWGLLDLGQAELRAAALISGDEEFAKALLSEDVHRVNAAKVFHYENPADVPAALRKRVKSVVFGVLYGGTPPGLAARMGIPVDDVVQILDGFFGQFKKLGSWLKFVKFKGVKDLEVYDVFGRRRSLREVAALEGLRSVERKACNSPVQGLANHIALVIQVSMSAEFRSQGLYSRTLFGVHDATMLEVYPTEVDQVAQTAQRGFLSLNNTPLADLSLWGTLPLVGDLVLGSSWASTESTSDYYGGAENLVFPCSSLGGY